MKLIRMLFIVFLPFVFICNVYSNTVAIYTDIQTKKGSFNWTDALFSPDSKYVVHTFGKPCIYFYNIYDANISFRIDYDKSMTVEHIEFSPDGNYMAVIVDNFYNHDECFLCIYETKNYSLRFIKHIYNGSYTIRESKLFTYDSKYIVFCQTLIQNTEIVFLNTETGEYDRRLLAKYPIDEIVISNDCKKILVQYGIGNRSWYLWHIEKDNFVETLTTIDWKDDLQFSPDSKYFFNEDHVWNANTGQFIKTFKSDVLKIIKKISNDNKHILLDYLGYTKVSYREDFYEKIFLDELELKSLKNNSEYTNRINYDCYTNAGKYFHTNISDNLEFIVATDTEDRSILLCKANFQLNKKQEENPICKISVFTDNEWISLTPDGFYNSSPNGDKYVHIRYNLDVYDLSQFTKSYFQPDVLIARVLEKPDPKCVAYYGDIMLSSPPPIISIVQNEIIENCFHVQLRVLNYGKNVITDVSFYRNGKYLGNTQNEFKKYITAEKIDSIEIDVPLELEKGKNYIEIVANTDICYGMQTIILESEIIEKKDSDLYILSIGINKYLQPQEDQDSNIVSNLHHAVEDSKAITSILKEKLSDYKSIHINQINDDAAIKPTKDKILESISMFEQMSENDDAIIFIAAHGVINNGSFYILPNDYKINNDSEIIDYSSAISIEDILNKLTFLGRKIVLLDSCMSGGIQKNYTIKTFQNKSIALLTAAQENEFALESANKGGLFTQSLISYFSSVTPESYNLNEMAKFIYDEVRDMSRIEKRGRIKQSPYFCIPDGFSDFSF